MSQFTDEIEAQRKRFDGRWPTELATARTAMDGSAAFVESYRLIVTFQAWRVELLEKIESSQALAFLVEAQNDLLTSHVQAGMGIWRSALKALRSCIENTLFYLYYKDHPVELVLWTSGQHRLATKDLYAYFEKHPLIHPTAWTEIKAAIEDEYSTLSKAVHGGLMFRMTGPGGMRISSSDVSRLGMWSTRQKHVVRILNRLLLSLYSSNLQGAAFPNLRRACGLAIPRNQFEKIKRETGVQLIEP